MPSIILTESSQFCLLYVLEPKEVAILDYRELEKKKKKNLLLGAFYSSLTSRNPKVTFLPI